MSSKFKRLVTENEIGKERAFEIRIRNVKTNKSKSFSLLMEMNTSNDSIPSTEELKDFFENAYKEAKNK